MKPEWIQATLKAIGLKSVPRSGWVRMGVVAPESVAAHSWGMTFLVLTTLPPELSLARALTYAALHDLAETTVGDFTPHDGVPKAYKFRLESAAMKDICDGLERGTALYATWLDYEKQSDDEAKFVHQLDKLDMALQAVWYTEKYGLPLDEFIESAARAVNHPILRVMMDSLATYYQRVRPS